MADILFVDADRDLTDRCRRTLESEGHRVATAASAKEALRKLDDAPPDLVVTDVPLPGMDGFELLYRIREKDRTMPVVLHCSSPWYGERYAAWAADAFVVKGTDLAALRAAVRGLAGGGALPHAA